MYGTRIYKREIVVTAEAIDANGHVNNLVYMRWFIEAAQAHAEAAGWGPKACEALGATWVARSHCIRYLHPAFEGDVLILSTWIEKVEKVKTTRRYLLEKSDATIVCRGESVFVFVDRETSKPRRIPQKMEKDF